MDNTYRPLGFNLVGLKRQKGNYYATDIVTAPAGAVAKYCDKYVCVCVCLSPESHARSLPFLCILLMAVARSSSSVVAIR